MKKLAKYLVIGIATSLVLGACSSPRGLNHKATRPIADISYETQSEEVQAFAKEIALAPDFTTIHMAYTPFGSNLDVEVGQNYINGLSQKCRKARVEGSYNMQDFAVCEDSDGIWRYIPSLSASIR